MNLADAVVLVTGSSRGIGAAIAAELVLRGAQVIVHGRSIDRLAPAASALGAKALAVDLVDPDGPDRLVAAAEEVYGRIDGVVHCAGVGWWGEMCAMSSGDLDRMVTVNLTAPLRVSRLILPGMVARGSGHVAFVGSIAGLTGVAREAVYSATKAGLITFCDSLRLELNGTGVDVSAICPGAVRTEFFARRGAPYQRRFPRLIGAERVAKVAVDGIEGKGSDRVIPRWLGIAPALRATLPATYRRLAMRFG